MIEFEKIDKADLPTAHRGRLLDYEAIVKILREGSAVKVNIPNSVRVSSFRNNTGAAFKRKGMSVTISIRDGFAYISEAK